MNRPTADAEWRRLAEATSLTALVADHVSDVAAVAIEDVPWLANLPVPDGWHAAITPDHRVRVAVYGNRPDGGWEASDTVSVFSFTGTLTPEVLSHNADVMLRSLTATGIRIYSPNTPPVAGVAAARASGYITVAGRSLWARFNTYVANTPHARLVQHSSFVDAESFRALGADIGTLTAGVEDGFWSTIDATAAPAPAQDASSPAGDLLSEDERDFLAAALHQWTVPAQPKPLPISRFDFATGGPEFDRLVERLADAVQGREALSADDWTRVLLLTEFAWTSTLVGAGTDFAAATGIADADALALLRSVQRKLRRYAGADAALLFPDARRNDTAGDA